MRVSLFVHRFYPSFDGTQTLAYELSRRIARKGHDITVSTSSNGLKGCEDIVDGVIVERLPRIRVPGISYPWSSTYSSAHYNQCEYYWFSL